MEKDFLNRYKNKFDQLNSAPPNDAWENISNELDLDEVWQEINFELNKKDKRKTIAKTALALALLISLVSGLLFLNDKQVADNKTKGVYKNPIASNLKKEKVNLNTITTDKTVENTGTYNKNSETKIERPSSTPVITTIISSKEKEAPSTIKNNVLVTSTENTHLNATANNEKNNVMQTIAPIVVFIKINDDERIDYLINKPLNDTAYKKTTAYNKYSDPDVRSFIVGAAFANANTWLLNNDTYSGLKAGTLNKTIFSFGKSYNVLVGYNISNSFCLQAEWVINNTHNQNYIDYEKGHRISKDLKVDYTQLNVLIKKKHRVDYFKNKLHTSFNYIAGLNYSYVKTFTQQTNETINSVKNEYQKNQYGLILGLEYQIFIRRVWIISSGIRTNMGLQNIYKGDGYLPSDFNKTYDSSLGLNVGISYQINNRK